MPDNDITDNNVPSPNVEVLPEDASFADAASTPVCEPFLEQPLKSRTWEAEKKELKHEKNWSAFVSIVFLIIGFVVGFAVPIVGFLFYIFGGSIALIFAIISVSTHQGDKRSTVSTGALICSILLTAWGLLQMVMFPIMLSNVVSFIGSLGGM